MPLSQMFETTVARTHWGQTGKGNAVFALYNDISGKDTLGSDPIKWMFYPCQTAV